jgi:hypothetical protein
MKTKPIILKTLVYLALTVAVERFCHRQTAGFQVHKVLSSFPFDKNYAIPSITEEQINQTNLLLDQKYYFLGFGGQGYSFLSEDGLYVLKLFKIHHMRVPNYFEKIPTFGSIKKIQEKWSNKCEKKHRKIFSSCKLAYDDFKEETGLLFLHLNKTKGLHPKISVINRIGVEVLLPLDNAVFALQKKADLSATDITKLINEPEALKRHITAFLEHITNRCGKGIEDTDSGLSRNYGYVGKDLIQIDIGSLRKKHLLQQPYALQQELKKKTRSLRKLLKTKAPSELALIEDLIENQLKRDHAAENGKETDEPL